MTADDDACVAAGQTAIVRWILPLRMPLTGRTLTGFDSNYVFDLGGAKRARTADLLHANARHHYSLLEAGPMRAAAAFPRETSRLVKRFGTPRAVDSIDLTGCTHNVRGYPRSACAHLIEEVAQDPQIFIDVAGLVGETGVRPGA
jgi:hypothetical protein